MARKLFDHQLKLRPIKVRAAHWQNSISSIFGDGEGELRGLVQRGLKGAGPRGEILRACSSVLCASLGFFCLALGFRLGGQLLDEQRAPLL
jgi:hypothetical protein